MSHRLSRTRKGRTFNKSDRTQRLQRAQARTGEVRNTEARQKWSVLSWFSKPPTTELKQETAEREKPVLASSRITSHSRSDSGRTDLGEESDIQVSSDSEETGSSESTDFQTGSSASTTSIRVSSTSSTQGSSAPRSPRWVKVQVTRQTSQSDSDSKVDTTSSEPSEAPRKTIKKNPAGERVRAKAQGAVDLLKATPSMAKRTVEDVRIAATPPEELVARRRHGKNATPAQIKKIKAKLDKQERIVENTLRQAIGHEKGNVNVLAFLQRLSNGRALPGDGSAIRNLRQMLAGQGIEYIRLDAYAKGLLACREMLKVDTRAFQQIKPVERMPLHLQQHFALSGRKSPGPWLDLLIDLRAQHDRNEGYRSNGELPSLLVERLEARLVQEGIPKALLEDYSRDELVEVRSYLLAWEVAEAKQFKAFPAKDKTRGAEEHGSSRD